MALTALVGAGVVALVAGQTDAIARWVAFGVLAIGLTLFVRAWRGDPEFNADGAAFAACILAAGVAVPFLLGFIGVLLAAVLVPASTGMFARHWVQATQRSTAAAAWFCGLTVTPLASWFGGRADERPLEGFIAGLLLVAVVGALLSIRRFERSIDRSSTGIDGGRSTSQIPPPDSKIIRAHMRTEMRTLAWFSRDTIGRERSRPVGRPPRNDAGRCLHWSLRDPLG